MLVGIDLDNTIINYDSVFKNILNKKTSIKDNHKKILKKKLQSVSLNLWTKTQGEVYGMYIHRAKLSDNFQKFLDFAKKNSIKIIIVSHKTKFPIIGKKINLHNAAISFLNKNIKRYKFIKNKDIFFEETLNNKLKKIKELDCDFFIDDLNKILNHKKFSKVTEKIFFGKNKNNNLKNKNWSQIIKLFKNKIKNLNNIENNNKVFQIYNKLKIVVKNFGNENSFKNELKFYQYLKKNNLNVTPKILKISHNKKSIKYSFIKKKNNLKIDQLILKNIKFINNINYFDIKKNNFSLAKDVCLNGKSYKLELYKRLKSSKRILENIKLEESKLLSKKLLEKFQILVKNSYFDKIPKIKKNELILSPCDYHWRNMIINNKKIFYIDFEYSGLDDISKLFAVYFLQPEKKISLRFYFKYIEFINKLFKLNKSQYLRMSYLLPIIYLRWSFILINKILKKKSQVNKRYQLVKVLNYLSSRNNYFVLYKKFT
ncbi:hypothetical protein [Candidatus Pelagibacter communis]|uniref:Deoxynucleotidase n=1 Tax=Pelagibacter ubique (strain HTCC1062) TaxID=335992 RepID=Q4FN83_PELUB|nr:hypothetical protein [Candidatus Pelagibacter ubique]AAZ21356.1 deoxynucleotidase [Candidatus Pelagibacter ubique HTCC1062]